MAFYRASGTANIQWLPGAASTALTANSLVSLTSGTLTPTTASLSYTNGICMETRASTDADYTTARNVMVDVVGPDDIVYCDNITGTATAAMVGQYMKISSTTGLIADAGTATDTIGADLVLMFQQFVTATTGYFTVNGMKGQATP